MKRSKWGVSEAELILIFFAFEAAGGFQDGPATFALHSTTLSLFCRLASFVKGPGAATTPPATVTPPPSSFRKGLQLPNGEKANRRISRTDMDFEQALKGGGTVVLEEGRRIDSLGKLSSRPQSPHITQPGTPVVVPPTPTNSSKKKERRPTTGNSVVESTPSRSPYDLDNADMQTKRRSMFRSPGTASSPDLATLVRKAKERGGVVLEPRSDEPNLLQPSPLAFSSSSTHLSPNPALINNPDQRTRTRSSTSSSYSLVSSPSSKDEKISPSKGDRQKVAKAEKVLGVVGAPMGNEISLATSRTVGKEAGKKSTMRTKTTALWSKMTGQSSGRARSDSASNTIPHHPTTPITPISAHSVFNPNSMHTSFQAPSPLPPVPYQYRKASNASGVSANETFSSSANGSTVNVSNLSKPLPPIYLRNPMTSEEEVDQQLRTNERSLRLVPSAVPPRAKSRPPVNSPKAGRRRSMSAGDADLHQVLAMAGRMSSDQDKKLPDAPAPLPASAPVVQGDRDLLKGWNLTATGDLNDFRGAFAELTAPSPSKPDRPRKNSRVRSDSSSVGLIATACTPITPSRKNSAAPPNLALDKLERTPSTSSRSDRYFTPPSTSNSLEATFRAMQALENAHEKPAEAKDSVTPTPGGFPARSTSLRSGRSHTSPRLNRANPPPHVHRSVTAPGGHTRELAMTLTSPSQESIILRPIPGPSISEPSLIPDHPILLPRRGSEDVRSTSHLAGAHARSVRLVQSNNSLPYAGPSLVKDTSPSDYVKTTFGEPSSSASSSRRLEDPEELDAYGRECAEKCWIEDDTFLTREKIAEWLGGLGKANSAALRYYIDHFDFSGLRLDNAFRHLCGKLFLKGETQQVDRILEEFSRRYWDCNPASLYGSAGVVHSVSYSLLLLNTDLHIAELASHMSRGQFVRNTLSAVNDQIRPPTSASSPSVSLNPAARSSSPDLTTPQEESPLTRGQSMESTDTGVSTLRMRTKRSGSLHSWKSGSREGFGGLMMGNSSTPQLASSSATTASSFSAPIPQNGSLRIATSGSVTYGRAWENDMETLLKEMYTSIKSHQILQPSPERASTSSLTPHNGAMPRSRSQRSNGPPDRLTTLKRGSIRGIQSLLGSQSPYSSNSSVDGRVSPSPSFATSIGDGISASSSSLFAPTLGFASNLSHTIIKEAQEDDLRSEASIDTDDTSISISDEELALMGAPWAKEGMLSRKQYWESSGKRAKDKNWMDVFVVIQKGELSMFTFGGGASTGMGDGVGGGNWLSSAQQVGNVNLAHSLAHSLPPPGYNRSRPHCLVLTLSTDAVYFFQAGTEDLVNEWVSTCNYWAARLSKEPLAGGVSNMEYGWNRVSESADDPPDTDAFSMRSGRSKLSKKSWPDHIGSGRAQYSPFAMEKIFINEWRPPMTPMVASNLDEESQMEALQKQASLLKVELAVHDKLQVPMRNLYQPRAANALKAQANWEQKSKYLLAEIFKYDTYVESLRNAMSLRLQKRGEKVLERALVATPDAEEDAVYMGLAVGQPQRKTMRVTETIQETDEPTTPGPGSNFFTGHRKQVVDG